jgi:predicted alpha/beta hydrolase family esterase
MLWRNPDMRVEWNAILEEWQATVGTVLLSSPSQRELEDLLDRLDEQQERRRENVSIVGAAIVGAFLLALAAVVSAALTGC